jgi:ribosomal protein L33
MPKVKGGVVKLVSLAGTGIFYTTRKNPKAATKKLS